MSNVEALVALLQIARDAYYNNGDPLLTDAEYDAHLEVLRGVAPHHSLLQTVGAVAGGKTVAHKIPMLSLDKCHAVEELLAWVEGLKIVSPMRIPIIIEPKIDGVSASLFYEGGKLVRAATRGDGLMGTDITSVVLQIPDVPQRLAAPADNLTVEIRGEIYMKLSVFRTFGEKLKHPRNAVVGALSAKGGSQVAPSQLSFLAYEIPGDAFDHNGVAAAGLPVAPYAIRAPEDFRSYVEHALPKERQSWDFEADGAVFKLQGLAARTRLGNTAHHPRWAIAFKFAADAGIALVDDIQWQVSRRQVITPVATFSPPVRVAGADISNATLFNLSTFDALGLTHGARVLVARRGGVIPHVEQVLSRTKEGKPFGVPAHCPACGAATAPEDTGGAWVLRCTATECGGSQARQLEHWCKALGADGFGPVVCSKLVRSDIASEVEDLYCIDWQGAAGLLGPGIARNLADNLLFASRGVAVDKLLQAMALPAVGETLARRLAGAFKLDDLLDASPDQLTAQCPGLGLPTAIALEAALQLWFPRLVGMLQAGHLTYTDAIKTRHSGIWEKQTVCFTGELPVDRAMATGAAERLGAVVTDAVTKKTTILVAADNKPSTKFQKAAKRGITIMSGADFMALAFGNT